MVEMMNGHANDEGRGSAFNRTSSNKSNNNNNNRMSSDNVCRDFLRNVCRRGQRCKFRHPDESEVDSLVSNSSKPILTFCHDHQNGICSRTVCR